MRAATNSLAAVRKFSCTLNCPKFTPAQDRCGSASHAATVNPTTMSRPATARAPEQQKADPPPYVPGMEAVGTVDEAGSGVPDRLKPGRRRHGDLPVPKRKPRRVSRARQ